MEITTAPPATHDFGWRRWLPWALAGLLGTVLAAALPWAHSWLPPGVEQALQHSPLYVLRTGPGLMAARLGALLGGVLLLWAWMRLHPKRVGGVAPLRWIAVLWCVPLVLSPPWETADPYAYAAQGWLLQHGHNPYEVMMGSDLTPYQDGIFITWQTTTAVYPPLALELQRLMVVLGGSDPFWGMMTQRLIAITGVVMLVAFAAPLARLLGRDPHTVVWALALNPLVVLQLIGGAHNDAMMLGFIALALYLAKLGQGRRWAFFAIAVTIGVAMAIKQPAALGGICAVFLWTPQQRRSLLTCLRDAVVGGVIATGVFLAISYGTGLGLGWLNKTGGNPAQVINHSPFSWIAQAAIQNYGVSQGKVSTALTVVSGLLILVFYVFAWRKFNYRHPIQLLSWLLLGYGFLGPAIQPWYALWGGAFLPLTRHRLRFAQITMSIMVLLIFSSVLTGWFPPPVGVPIAAVVALAWYRFGPLPGRRPTLQRSQSGVLSSRP